MKNSYFSSNRILLGIFLLMWATFAYVLIGNIGKYLSLAIGLYCIMTSVFVGKIQLRSILILLKAVSVFLVFVFLAFELNQTTTDMVILAFGVICVLLFFGGHLYSMNKQIEKPIESKIVVIIATLSILGAFKLYRMQAVLLLEGGRDLGEESLNAVGVAYVCGQVFLLLFWLYNKVLNLKLKILLITAMVAIGVALLITESRGAVVFLIATLIWFYKDQFKFILKLKTIVVFLFLLGLIMFAFRNNKILDDKFTAVSSRFESAFDHLEGDSDDGSLEERMLMQSVFYENYDQMIFGYPGYKPYPHNQIIEICMRWGVFGIPILLISLFSFVKSIKYPKLNKSSKSSLPYLIVSIFFFSYLQSMSSLSLEMNRMMWFGFGFFLVKRNNKH